MDKMRQEVKEKLTYWTRICAMFTCLIMAESLRHFHSNAGADNFNSFFDGFQFGISLVFLIYALKNIVTHRNLLKDEAQLKRWYIQVHDERTAAICAKTGGIPMHTCGVLFVGAGIIAGYFNITVFITLTVCGVFLLIVCKGLYVYYSRKM